ncbi:MAG: hypothetical protein HUU10_00455 [Bacteroidetes bacterium]|nr:hypothetical protein [Bacteroidota bacterium]
MSSGYFRSLSAPQLTLLSFFLFILVGSILLWISESSNGLPFIDALFTSVSATCVTGLLTTDFSKFTFAGQFITMILIQVGGISVIAFLRLIWYGQYNDRGFLSHRILGEIVDIHGASRTVLYFLYSTIRITIAIEMVGFVFLWFFADEVSGWQRVWLALFTSVSAFNNAGISIFYDGLVPFADNFPFSSMVMLLIILGGIGYPVLIGLERLFLVVAEKAANRLIVNIETRVMTQGRFEGLFIGLYTITEATRLKAADMLDEIKGHATTVQIKVVILWTFILLLAGTVFFFLIEQSNPQSIGGYGTIQQWFHSLFMSVTSRTAGFNIVDTTHFVASSYVFLVLLMFVGAAPQGTAGGIKITTFALVVAYLRDSFKGLTRVRLFGQVIARNSISNAVKLYVMSTAFIFLAALILIVLNPDYLFMKVLFDTVSAFGTVGLSSGFCNGELSDLSKGILILAMFIGRVNLLNVGAAFFPRIEGPVSGTQTEDGIKLQVG